jgi:tetratricopeptide (TPR) repeat protein
MAETAHVRRLWRWDQVVLVGLLLTIAAAIGCRPGSPRLLWEAVRIAMVSSRAAALAVRVPEQAAAAWARLGLWRPADPVFQGLVLARRLAALEHNGDHAAADQLADRLPRQPAWAAGEPTLMLAAGRYLLRRDRADEAVVCLETGLRRAAGPGEVGVGLRLALARAYRQLGRTAEAEQCLVGLWTAQPHNPWVCLDLAQHYADRDAHLDQAHALAQRALTAVRRRQVFARRDVEATARLGRCLDTLGWVEFRRNRRDRALELLRQAARCFPAPGDVLNLYHQAEVNWDAGQDNDALFLVNQALKLDPGHEASRLLRDRIEDSPERNRAST